MSSESNEVREWLRSATRDLVAAPPDVGLIRRRGRRLKNARRFFGGVGLLVVMLVVVVAGRTVPRWSDDSSIAQGGPGEWRAIPSSPTSSYGAAGFRGHGRVLLVTPAVLSEFDIEGERWNEISEVPTVERDGMSTAATTEHVFVWGGSSQAAQGRADGFLYRFDSGEWTPLPQAPIAPRAWASVLWTGNEYVVWGGTGLTCCGEVFADGAAYNPDTNSWRPLSESPLSERVYHSAIWTGEEMLVWGGSSETESGSVESGLSDGAAYEPATDTWRTVADAPIEARALHTSVWTGDRMVVWGGTCAIDCYLPDGAVYDPAVDEWKEVSPAPLAGRIEHAAAWTDRGLVVWGGFGGQLGTLDDGARYDPDADEWVRLPDSPLESRHRHVSVWTGDKLFVWGGCCSKHEDQLDDGALFVP